MKNHPDNHHGGALSGAFPRPLMMREAGTNENTAEQPQASKREIRRTSKRRAQELRLGKEGRMNRVWIILRNLSAASIVVLSLACLSCNSPTSTSLTTARDVRGTWKCSFPIKMTYQTNFRNENKTENVATADWDVTWVITGKTSDSHEVDITMTFTASNKKVLIKNNGYIPQVSPMYFKGNVSGATLTVNHTLASIGSTGTGKYEYSGGLTTDIMKGTWKSYYNGLYYSGEVSATDEFILNKQK
jgi:hypothetical protein